MKRQGLFILTVFFLVQYCGSVLFAVGWGDCLKQKGAWYGSSEAIRIADNVLLYQRSGGGWPKNTDMAKVLSNDQKDKLKRDKGT